MKTNLAIPDNCILIFTEEGLKMRVTLNIPKDLVEYIPKFYLDKGKKFNTFVLISEVTDCTRGGIHSKYNSMVRKAMRMVRYYKIVKLSREIKDVNN